MCRIGLSMFSYQEVKQHSQSSSFLRALPAACQRSRNYLCCITLPHASYYWRLNNISLSSNVYIVKQVFTCNNTNH